MHATLQRLQSAHHAMTGQYKLISSYSYTMNTLVHHASPGTGKDLTFAISYRVNLDEAPPLSIEDLRRTTGVTVKSLGNLLSMLS